MKLNLHVALWDHFYTKNPVIYTKTHIGMHTYVSNENDSHVYITMPMLKLKLSTEAYGTIRCYIPIINLIILP